MNLIYTKNYFRKNYNNSTLFSQNFISFFKIPGIQIKPLNFTKKHTKFLKENLNKKIELSFCTYKKNINIKQPISNTIWLKKESFNHITLVTLIVKKILITAELIQKKQFIFLLKEIILGLQKTLPQLSKENLILKNIFLNNKTYFFKETKTLNLFYQQYLSNLFFNNTLSLKNINLKNSNTTEFYKKINNVLILTLFTRTINQTNIIFQLNKFLSIISPYWTPTKAPFMITTNTMQYKKILTTFIGQFNIQYFNTKANKVFNPNIYIWKNYNKKNTQQKSASTIHKNYFPLIAAKKFYIKNTFFIKQAKTRYTSTAQILYLLLRLEEKIIVFEKNSSTKNLAQELLKLYNTLHYQIISKQNNTLSTNLVLTNLLEILKLRNTEWKFLFLHAIKKWVNSKQIYTKQKTQNFFKQLWKKITKLPAGINKKNLENFRPQVQYKIAPKINLLEPIKKRSTYQKTTGLKQFFVNKKLVLTQTKYNFRNNKDILTRITNRPIKIFFINTLSLTKFAFNLERSLEQKESRSPTNFLQNIDRDLINKYKYIAIYIKDLIRICFISMYLKKANIIAQFIAFQLGKLPRNRKETSFIKFIIKVVKTFAAEREEILGLRIKFNGRVNRWRRTKAIVGERGVIPLHTMQNQIEYGTAHAINRKGAVGIKIWIHYNLAFNTILKESILKYFSYSKQLAIKKKSLNTIYYLK